ncbi:MAG: hypothetical protein VX777_05635 [Chlamydiota bacterium]|nr:hypothetical protein [Chlamydiota bacterium]
MDTRLSKNLRALSEALQQNIPVTWQRGGWTTVGRAKLFFQNLFNFRGNNLFKVAEAIEEKLDQLEAKPVRFSNEGIPVKQVVDFQPYLEVSDVLVKKLKSISSPQASQLYNRLKYKLLALKYRLEDVNGGVDLSPKQMSLINLLKKIVRDWKSNDPFLKIEEGVTQHDLLQIIETSHYPEFVHILTEDQQIRDEYLLWTIRDGNLAKVFIEYPALRKKLVDSQLNGRIGRVRNTDLKVFKSLQVNDSGSYFEKIVTLPFEGKDRCILDGSAEIVFKGNMKMTINEIFQMFEDKTYRVGNLEYLAHGIANWNVHKWGSWNAVKEEYDLIDFSHLHWWKQLPIFEIITQDEAFLRYNKRLDGLEWCVSATATRGTASLDYENTHAFMEVAIPLGDGRYAIYDFGKFAFKFPANFFESVSIFCQNLHATVAYPDENVFYSHRQQTYQSFTITPDQGLKLMDVVKADMLKSQQLNFVYQIESDNCAKWVYEHLVTVMGKGNVPDMFRMHLLDTEPIGPVACIFNLIKKLPKSIQTKVLVFFHIPMGATKETWIYEGGRRVCKSLSRHDFWTTGVVYLPALLHKKQEEGVFGEFVGLATQKMNNFINSHAQRLKKVKKYIRGNVSQFNNCILHKIISSHHTVINSLSSKLWELGIRFNILMHLLGNIEYRLHYKSERVAVLC